jgi:nicotinamidase-related amidase
MNNQRDSALVLIDLQNCMADPTRPSRNNLHAESNIELLLTAWRERCLPVIHVRHLSLESTSGFWPGQIGAGFQDRFKPEPNEHVVSKHVTDAFSGSGFERYLVTRGITALTFVGVSTNYSVEATARSAGCLGFRATVVSDACYTFSETDFNGRLWTADDIHQMALNNLHQEYAKIQTANQILSAVMR